MIKRKASSPKNKNFFSSQAVLFFLILVLLWSIIACVKITYKKHQMAREGELIQEKIEKLKEDNQFLAGLKSLLGDKSFLEKEAKKRLNLKNQGEEVVMIPSKSLASESEADGNEPTSEATANEGIGINEDILEKMANYKKWWIYFFE